MQFRYWVSPVLFLLVAGCATPLKTDTPEFEAQLRTDLALGAQELSFVHTSVLSPGSTGYGLISMLDEKMKQADGRGPQAGVLVLTDKVLHFAKLDGTHYTDAVKLDYSAIKNVEFKSFGLSRRIIVSWAEDDSLSLKVFTGGMVDRDESQRAFDILQKKWISLKTPPQ
jgi:hypothetical protein